MSEMWILRSCPVCGGDLFQDQGETDWVCALGCAREFVREPDGRFAPFTPMPVVPGRDLGLRRRLVGAR